MNPARSATPVARILPGTDALRSDISMSVRINVFPSVARPALAPAPVPRQWVRSGEPTATATHLWKSDDGTASTVLWECTAGIFDWHYGEEETVHVIEGEVFVEVDGAPRYRLGPGDTALFRAGARAVWTVPERVRKVAILRLEMPAVVSLPLRAWHKLARVVRSRFGTGASQSGLAGG